MGKYDTTLFVVSVMLLSFLIVGGYTLYDMYSRWRARKDLLKYRLKVSQTTKSFKDSKKILDSLDARRIMP